MDFNKNPGGFYLNPGPAGLASTKILRISLISKGGVFFRIQAICQAGRPAGRPAGSECSQT